MTDRSQFTLGILVAGAVAAGCSGSHTASQPAAMAPQEHCAAAEYHHGRAVKEQRASENVQPTRTAVENRARSEHHLSANAHERRAAGHEQSAIATSNGDVTPCSWMQGWSY